MPSSFEYVYFPLNGGSVPWRLSTSYCSGVSSLRHSSSLFVTLVSKGNLQALAFPQW